MEIGLGIAFVAGFLSFFASCVFSMMPVYVTYLASQSQGVISSRVSWRILKNGGLFILGFLLVFMGMGALAGFLGFYLKDYLPWLTKISGIFLIIIGLHLIGILRVIPLLRERRLNLLRYCKGSNRGLFSFLMGISFSLGWTPCVGPVLGGILILAYSAGTALNGLMLLGSYSLGLALPFIFVAFTVGRIYSFFERFRKALRITEIISGFLLILTGYLIFSGSFSVLNRYFDFFPNF